MWLGPLLCDRSHRAHGHSHLWSPCTWPPAGSLKSENLIIVFCYGLKVCVPPKFICWGPNPHCNGIGGGFGIQWGWEAVTRVETSTHQGDVPDGTGTLIRKGRETRGSSFCSARMQQTICNPGRAPSPRTKSAGTVIFFQLPELRGINVYWVSRQSVLFCNSGPSCLRQLFLCWKLSEGSFFLWYSYLKQVVLSQIQKSK